MLPPALWGHQNYWLWGPRGYSEQCLIVIGDQRKRLEELINDVVQTGETDHAHAIPYESRRPIWIVRG